MLTMTHGTSAPAIVEMPSCFSEMPGLEEEVMTRAPAPPAPYTMLIAASSLSACRKHPPTCGKRSDMYSGMSFCGVIG